MEQVEGAQNPSKRVTVDVEIVPVCMCKIHDPQNGKLLCRGGE